MNRTLRAEPLYICSARHRERGATAVEFALLFPLFFIIFYAIVTFSLIFVAQQSLTLAAEEGARAVLNFQQADNAADALTKRMSAACTTATSMSNGLIAGSTCVATPNACTYDPTMDCVSVTLNYNYAANPLVPPVPLLNVVLPKQLTSTAMIQINPGYLL
jgi:Flp pilus assembly protein TadG